MLVARVGRVLRVAPDPATRLAGGTDWDAGPPADWCELGPDVLPDAISGLVARGCVSLTPRPGKAGRQERQALMHELGFCTRPAPHWSQ